MSELLPCPFCGGEPTAIETYPGRGELYCGNCDVVMGGNNAMTPEELTAAWNSRAERTCRIAEYADAPIPVCSECGAVHELETALRKACEFIAGYGSCPYDTFDLYEPWEESCYQKCSADINRAECWRRYFERGGDAE